MQVDDGVGEVEIEQFLWTWLLCLRKCKSSWAGPIITPQIEHLHQYEDETKKVTVKHEFMIIDDHWS